MDQPQKERTPAFCHSLYFTRSKALGSRGRGISGISFPGAMTGLMPVGGGFCTAGACAWRARVWERPSTLEPEPPSRWQSPRGPLAPSRGGQSAGQALPSCLIHPILLPRCSEHPSESGPECRGEGVRGVESGVSQICANSFLGPLGMAQVITFCFMVFVML